jgi:hypothetical protein
MRLLTAFTSFLLLSLATSRAFAQDATATSALEVPPATPPALTPLRVTPAPEPPREQIWYGWEPAITDGVALVLGGVAIGVRSDSLGYLAWGEYAAPAPTVHALRGHPGKAAASIGLRALLPLTGVFLGTLAAEPWRSSSGSSGSSSLEVGAVTGALAGAITAAILDDVLLAHEDAPVASEPAPPPSPGWHAGLAPTRGGATVGIAATF